MRNTATKFSLKTTVLKFMRMPPKENSKYFPKKEMKTEPPENGETSEYFPKKEIKIEPSENVETSNAIKKTPSKRHQK